MAEMGEDSSSHGPKPTEHLATNAWKKDYQQGYRWLLDIAGGPESVGKPKSLTFKLKNIKLVIQRGAAIPVPFGPGWGDDNILMTFISPRATESVVMGPDDIVVYGISLEKSAVGFGRTIAFFNFKSGDDSPNTTVMDMLAYNSIRDKLRKSVFERAKEFITASANDVTVKSS